MTKQMPTDRDDYYVSSSLK